VAALVDLVIALASGERGLGAFVEPLVILLILVANGGRLPSLHACLPACLPAAWLNG
jgi:hypothetical protein